MNFYGFHDMNGLRLEREGDKMKPVSKSKPMVIRGQIINGSSGNGKKKERSAQMNWGCRLKIEG